MAKVCDVTGKRPMTGNNVSHSKRRTKRRFKPNIHQKYFDDDGRRVKLNVSAAGLRMIMKLGIKEVLARIQKRGIQQ